MIQSSSKYSFVRRLKTGALILAAAAGAVVLTGCGSVSHMRLVETQVAQTTQAPVLESDKSYVVFFRPSGFVGRALSPALVDATDPDNPRLVGIFSNATKLIHETTPGSHQYFINSLSITGPFVSHIFKAEFDPGKIYYVRIMGGGSLTPVDNVKDEKFLEDYKTSRWVENTPESNAWFDARTSDFVDRYEQIYQLLPEAPAEVDGYGGKIRYGVIPSFGTTEMIWDQE